MEFRRVLFRSQSWDPRAKKEEQVCRRDGPAAQEARWFSRNRGRELFLEARSSQEWCRSLWRTRSQHRSSFSSRSLLDRKSDLPSQANLTGPAAPAAAKLAPSASRPGYHLSRYSAPIVSTRKSVDASRKSAEHSRPSSMAGHSNDSPSSHTAASTDRKSVV